MYIQLWAEMHQSQKGRNNGIVLEQPIDAENRQTD